MIRILLTRQGKIRVAWIMLFIMTAELLLPNISFALSSGPVQPEVQGFEPVGTTDMVDPFTGDFVYNIPLMDVEGYPLNISYHGGVTMEQEASWVGLGWSLTPGSVNRGLRGLPDDFAGDTVEKEVNIKPEITKKIGVAAGVEAFGLGEPYISVGVNLGGYLTMSNYRGVSADFTASAGINTKFQMVSAGLNLGASVGSQSGAAIDYSASLGLGASKSMGNDLSASGSFNLNTGGVYSPRTGMRQNVGFNVGLSMKQAGNSPSSASMSTGATVPIGMQNYTAAITNASYMNGYSGQLKLGGEVFGVYIQGKVSGSVNTLKFDANGSRKAYGYFNLDKAEEKDLVDFSREKDGMYNTTMKYLPQSHLTYDIYNVNGQGTGGSFRPFRNDLGSAYDPTTQSEQTSESFSIEGGVGNLFEVGGEYTQSTTKTESGPWSDYKRPFTGKATKGYYEDVYFKEAGELTENNSAFMNSAVGNSQLLRPEDVKDLSLTKPDADKRVVRANHIYTVSGKDEDTTQILDSKALSSYTDVNGFRNYPNVSKVSIARVDTDPAKKLKRKSSQVSEIIQTQKDGRRYIYGLPVMNNVQREAIFAVNPQKNLSRSNYLIGYSRGVDDSMNNPNGIDNYYSSTVTPSYVTSHLLTGVLSKDYVDVTGNGITEDDLGTYTKFNYSRKSTDYRWRTPLDTGASKAQYMPGYTTDTRDDKASYLIGSREQWELHSVETKNYVAEFYVSPRADAFGSMDKILGNKPGAYYNEAPYNVRGDSMQNRSYKLDSIVLYNKHDRFINKANAQPIKTVMFSYNYSLCPKVPNSINWATAENLNMSGKLTLTKIQIRFGNSSLNMSAPYSFKYDSAYNYRYDIAAKDRWGFYKPSDPQFNNFEYPFTTQSAATNEYAKAWSLSEIHLPSGGVIKADYESDDYAYVQDKEAMEMFKVTGMGNSTNYEDGGNQLYFSTSQPNLYFYFKRRKDGENGQIGFRDNYLKGTSLMYYNIPVELKAGLYEPIKGYAEIVDVGICGGNTDYGYVKISPRKLEGTSTMVNPVVFTALNVGRYSLPHILFPGSDPESTDIGNIVAGLKNSIHELFNIQKNPLEYLINQGKAQEADLAKAFIRLTSPGLAKKGGGQRVKQIRFFDSWDKMTGGNPATYGKQYNYNMVREDGLGVISSGVASYEPMTGGDEIPQRLPVGYQAQGTNNFPPNDPVELYQEMPLGESFFPSPVVGYRRVTVRSINIDKGRSSQSEDIQQFYTAKDFPIKTDATEIKNVQSKNISLKDISVTQTSTQGFSIMLNDMHGKPRNTEHWMLKPDSTARELINYQQYEYLTGQNGQLSNDVPSYSYDGSSMNVANRKMGIETDVTIDSRIRNEESQMTEVSANLNGFMVFIVPIVIPLPYKFTFGNVSTFKCATVNKVTQQYGILNKVISNNQGAITEVRNEVFDAQTGNALVTSVNNEFNDREYTANYPAYWAYKEMGPSYENYNLKGTFSNPLSITPFTAANAAAFVNYNGAFSSHFDLPVNMPVAKVLIDEEMPKFKLGDELLLSNGISNPVRFWVMGYTSDLDHCYLIMATRQPYKDNGFGTLNTTYQTISYQVLHSGNKNRLGESIQNSSSTDQSNYIPSLKNDLNNLISLNAQRYNHNLNQVFAANQVSDSINPFITGKIGIYRPEMDVVNFKKRDYVGGLTRNSGTFSSASYWKTEQDNFGSYCPDSVIRKVYDCEKPLDSFNLALKPSTNYITLNYYPLDSAAGSCNPTVAYFTWMANGLNGGEVALNSSTTPRGHGALSFNAGTFIQNFNPNTSAYLVFYGNYPGLPVKYEIRFDGTNFRIGEANQIGYGFPYTNRYVSPTATLSSMVRVPYRVRRKILLGKVGHYAGSDQENWVNTHQVTKYNWYGEELENKELGSVTNSAIYGYNQQLPVCVIKNARHEEVLFDGFEDYALLNAHPDNNQNYMRLYQSPFAPLLQTSVSMGSYDLSTLISTATDANFAVSREDAHTGLYSIKVNQGNAIVPLNATDAGMANGYSFRMKGSRKYVASVWLKPTAVSGLNLGYTGNVSVLMDTLANGNATGAVQNKALIAKSNIIDGWQQYELVFDAPAAYKNFRLLLGNGFYYDDLRIYPFESNSKGFVYHPVTRKLMATLDENNFATFYEYDAEGNLVRTKKETEKGILTVNEARSTHYKANN